MSVPAQVRKQVEAVNQLYADLNAAEPGPDAQSQAPVSEVQQPADNVAPEPTPAVRAVEQPETGKDESTFEQRYKSLQGMYNAEVPRLQATNRELTARVQQLEQLLASMNSPAAPAPAAQKLLTQEDEEAYGDSISVMRKVFREEMVSKDAEIAELKQALRQMQTNVVPRVHELTQTVAVSNDQRFWADLQAAVPDWQDINSNPAFHTWLLETDPLTGMQRQTYLEAAQRALDARRVATFFSLWKGQTGNPIAQEPRPAPAPSQLTAQIAPGKGRSGAVPAQASTKTYTRADVQKFYTDVQKGLYRGRTEERDRIERDIFAAQSEGRITD